MRLKNIKTGIFIFLILLAATFFSSYLINSIYFKDKNNELPVEINLKSSTTLGRTIGGLDINRIGYGITYSNNIVYIAGTSGIFYIDVSDATDPYLIGEFTTEVSCEDVFVIGDLVYVADGRDIAIVDFSDINNPIEIGRTYCPSDAFDIIVHGNYAYCGSSRAFTIFDISDPYNPILLGQMSLDSRLYEMKIQDNIAYIAGSFGLYCIDISDPRNPAIMGSIDVSSDALDIIDNIAFIGQYGALIYIDISDPYNPNIIGSINTAGKPLNIKIQENILYMAGFYDGIAYYDITERTNPRLLGYIELQDMENGYYVYELSMSDDICYVGVGNYGLQCVDITNTQLAMGVSIGITPYHEEDFIIQDNIAYIVGNSLTLLDISVPLNPVRIAELYLPSNAYNIVLNGNIAILACHDKGIQCVDVSDLFNPILIGNCNVSGNAKNIKVQNNIAYIACRDMGISIVDITDPFNPCLLTEYYTQRTALFVEILDNTLIIGDDLGLLFVDITNPLEPVTIGTYDDLGYTDYFTIQDNYVYISASSRYTILDMQDPTNPVFIGSYSTGFTGASIKIYNNDIYTAEFSEGVVHLDFSDPYNPSFERRYDSFGEARQIERKENYLYILIEIGLQVIDLNYPILPGKTYLKNIEYNSQTGDVHLQWTEALNTEIYAIYRDTSQIIEINDDIQLVSTTNNLEYIDNIKEDGTFYYAITTTNNDGVVLSNCREINTIFLGLVSPKLAPIVPFPSTDGKVCLTWNHVPRAEEYLVYRSTSPITQIDDGVILLATQTETMFIDMITTDGMYYYAIIAQNAMDTSSISNCEVIDVLITPPEENTPIEHPNIPFIDIILEPLLQYDIGMDICVDDLGNLYVVGMVTDLNTGESDVYLFKFNIMGEIVFECTWSSGPNEYATGIALDSKGNIYVTGTTDSGSGNNNIFLLKYNPNGELIWDLIWGSENNEEGNDVVINSKDDIFVTGITNSFDLTSTEICLIKINPSGNVDWYKTWGTNNDDIGNALVIDNLDNIYITGTANNDVCVLKYNSEGILIWSMVWGGENIDSGQSIAMKSSSDYIYITGSTQSYGSGTSDIFLLKLGIDGHFYWAVTYGDEGWEGGKDLTIDLFGNIYIIGNIGEPPSHTGIVILKFRPSGTLVWNYIIEQETQTNIVASTLSFASEINSDNLMAQSICIDNFGAVFITGSSDSSDNLMLNKIEYSDGDPKMGDVNGDDTVNIIDALLVAQYYVGLEPSELIHIELADVNNDGIVDIVDAWQIAKNFVS
ncbi:MAG: SBBP repeat-containing protein [Candidatus Lokiarchaeota archaeon]|nr:SBBP repeat-containing protein [Candidatus Lokiarchaeota archaeon]